MHFNDTLMSCKDTRVIQSNNSVYTTLSIAKTSDSFPGMVLNLNNNESSNKYLSVNISVIPNVVFCNCNLLHTKYK